MQMVNNFVDKLIQSACLCICMLPEKQKKKSTSILTNSEQSIQFPDDQST